MRMRGFASLVMIVVAAADARADALADAAALEKDGRFEEAAAIYEKAAPASAPALLAYCRVLVRLSRPADAEQAAADALAKTPGDVALTFARAEARLAVCDAALSAREDESKVMDKAYEGLGWVKKALQKDAKSFAGRLLQARYTGFISHDASDAARKILEDLTAEDPKSADAWFELGRHWGRRAGDKKNDEFWANAEKALLTAVGVDPMRGDALVNLGRAKGWLDRPREEVAACFEKGAMVMPGDPAVLALLAKWSPTPRANTEALRRIAEKRPNDRVVRFALAAALSKTRSFREGMTLLDKAAADAPKDPWVALDRAGLCVFARKFDFVADAAVIAIGLAKASPDPRFYSQADLLTLQEGLSAAHREAIWDALFDAFPKELEGPNNAAVWFRDKGHDFAKSAAWYERALSAAPEDVMLLNDTGLVYWHPNYLNDAAKAEPYFRRAVAAAKKQGVARPDKNIGYRDAVDNLGKLLQQQKRAADLRALAEEIKGDPRADGMRLVADEMEKPK